MTDFCKHPGPTSTVYQEEETQNIAFCKKSSACSVALPFRLFPRLQWKVTFFHS
jgi:hypothetical protein